MSKRLFILTSFVLVLSLVCNAGAQGTGSIMREVWEGIGGVLATDLTGNANYPDNPTWGDLLTSLEQPEGDLGSDFGERIHGYLHPATSGDYTFWIAADDGCELLLSTDDDPANAVAIAGHASWTGSREFDNMPEQMSAPVALEAGGKYYISAVVKEAGGGDNLAVAWQGPDSPERSVIDGSFLSPAPWNVNLLKAKDPNPADGAVDADTSSLEWAAGPSAVSYKVYLSTDETIEESELVAETNLTIHLAALDIGAAYYWRVDVVEADGTIREGNVWSFTTLPLEAHFPSPADGAKGIESGAKLSWTAGKGVIMHDVYFGTDEALVAAGDPSTFKGKVMVTSFDPGALELFMTYYWKIDEFSVTGTNAGPVWSFSAPGYIIIESSETTLNYDNTAEPYVSEIAWDVPADLRFGGVADLTLRFQGGAPSGVSLDEATGTYTVTGGGHDIWDSADDFHFAYRELTGDATIVARVVDNGSGSNAWAKGGVMIRQSTADGSVHAITALTGGNGGGGGFQFRPVADAGSSSFHDPSPAIAPPYYVRLERVGNDFTGSFSPDGVTWTQQGETQTIEMADPVLIGLAVTSHQTGQLRTFTFDNVGIEGDISADTGSQDIGDDPGGNAPAAIYVALEDSTGAVAKVTHGNPAATNIESWRQWTIPLDKFKGVDATSAAMLYVGVGDGTPGGTGSITVDDINVVKPTGGANIVWVSGFYDDNGDGAPDDQEWVDILTAAGHTVDYNPGWLELDDAQVATLNAADLVIVSRNSNSGDYDDGDEVALWNSVTTPIINSSTHIVRSSRWKWVDSTTILSLTPAMVLADGTEIPGINAEVGPASFIDAAAGNGTVLATGDGLPFIIEWEAGVEFYDGAGQTAGGPRVFFVAGTQEDAAAGIGRGEMNLSPEALAVFMDTVNKLLPAVSNDVTVPGDIVQGVPNDGDWPGGEYPALAIDDNTGTKFLHFKGETEPTGIQVTPLDGPTIVTGLSFTTANDATERDPISFELSGSNDSIDGPYELIASGDIVDFAQETAWPRFTKNETAISFANSKAYAHYQVMFPAVRDPGSANSMQIAEVELIGTPAPTPADVTAAGDVVKGVPDEPRDGSVAGWPDGEYPGLAVDDNVSTKFLHFRGEVSPTGFVVEPASGPSVVTGLTFTTANDAIERDPISFELSGSNDSIDGPYTLIASGDIVDFAMEAAWPRFTKNATPISFENDAAYKYYQVMFPAVRNPGSANSMQIAEVELIGVPGQPAAASLLSVVRSNGVSGDRDPVGPYDGGSAPLATEAGGLMDGNLVYSDRTYPWAGVPAEYVGTEYIRTYNSDKNGGTTDVTYEVTISRPAIVWITVDDRIPAEWDAGGAITSPQDAADYVTAAFAAPGTFVDTGIDMYVHENDTTDRSMSVYAAELAAGTYVFGSMDSGKNFYCIGAVE